MVVYLVYDVERLMFNENEFDSVLDGVFKTESLAKKRVLELKELADKYRDSKEQKEYIYYDKQSVKERL